MPLLDDHKGKSLDDLDIRWYEVRRWIKHKFGTRPDLNAILFLIGINEFGQLKAEFTKEEKQDLMHIAICRLFEPDGFFKFLGEDEDGWPHYEACKPLPKEDLRLQDKLLKERIILYFEELIKEESK